MPSWKKAFGRVLALDGFARALARIVVTGNDLKIPEAANDNTPKKDTPNEQSKD
jgi:hypothetical protein